MALINFGNTVNMTTIDNPPIGEKYLGYDLDGILKQKDYLGNITIIGASLSSATFSISSPLKGNGSLSNPLGLSMSSDFGLTNSGIELNLSSTLLVTPSISSNWLIFKTNSTTPFPTTTISGLVLGSQSVLNALRVPDGCMVNYSGVASIPSAGSLYSPPTSISGNFNFTYPAPLPVSSMSTVVSSIYLSTVFSCVISKPKTGLILSGSTIANAQVIRASGLMTNVSSANVIFDNLFYYGYLQIGPNGYDIDQSTVNMITPTQIQNLSNYRWGLKSQSNFIINDTVYGAGFRFVFAYLASDNNISNILTSLAPGINIVGSFLKMSSDITITTLSGKVLTYRVYVAKPNNSYNNVTINTIG